MIDTLGFIHRFEKGRPEELPLLLLHGTGGDENDLIPLGRMIAPTASLLSPRGKVLENGMPRFFRRLAEGVFDEDDVRRRANELADFIINARARYGIASPIALGYSNGANIAAAILLLRPENLAGAILLRAMPPFANPQPVKLDGFPVLIVSGARDPIIQPETAAKLALLLKMPDLAAVRGRSELIELSDERHKIREAKHDDCGDHQADDAEQQNCDKIRIVDHRRKSGQ